MKRRSVDDAVRTKTEAKSQVDNKMNTLYAHLLQGKDIGKEVLSRVRKQVIDEHIARKDKLDLENYFSEKEEIFRNVKEIIQKDPDKALELREIMRKEQKDFNEAAYTLTGAARN